MSEARIPTLPSATAVRQQAALWLQRKQLWDWSAEDQAALENWLSESPSHRVAYLRIEAAWTRTERLSALRSTKPERGAATKWFNWRAVTRIAVAVALLGAVGSGAAFLLAPQAVRYSTPVGGREILSLADGSKIELNTDTSLRVTRDSRQRTVWLDSGEAYFEVNHDATRPFVVIVGGHRITDLGTRFVVRQNGEHLEVTLLEGRARIESVTGAANGTVLVPGDVAMAAGGSLSVTKKPMPLLADKVSWRRGVLVFDHTKFGDAVNELNRYNERKLVISDPVVARLEIGGTFPSDNVELFGRAAKIALGLHVEDRGNAVVISR